MEDGHARLAWTVHVAIHPEVLVPHLLRNAERLVAGFEPQPFLSAELPGGGALEPMPIQDVDPYLWNVTVPTSKHKGPPRVCVLNVLVDRRCWAEVRVLMDSVFPRLTWMERQRRVPP